MPSSHPLLVPYLIDPRYSALDDIVTFCVAVLLAILVNAEAQGLVAALLGDTRPGAKDRLHFNAFLHLDLWGTICFLVGGFGWPRKIEIDPDKFQYPQLYLVLTRFAGPVANFLMANIAASIVWILGSMATNARVFSMIAGVNLTVAVYNLLPIPPLAGASLWSAVFGNDHKRFQQSLDQLGPFLLVAMVLVERISGWRFLGELFDPLVKALFNYIGG